MSGKISGIYVEIRGDYKQLKEDLSQAKAIVTQQSKGMSDALNNALSPDQIKKSVDKMVGSLNTLSNASKVANRSFASSAVDLKQYSSLVGVTEKEFAKLQSRMIQTSAAKAQENALRDIGKAAGLSAKEIAVLGKQMGVSAAGIAAVNGASRSASSSLSMLGTAAQAALAYFSVQTVIEFSRAVLDAGIAMDSLQRSFVAVTGSQAGAAETMKFLREEAGRLGQNFYALAPEFKNVMAAAKGTAMEGENVRKMFSAIAAASTALGLSADNTHGTLRALQQMMSKGTIQAEELRGQLGERLPGALNLMAKAMGVSTAELNKMMADGKLLADDALPKLTKEIERMYGAAAETAALESGQAAVNRLSQAWTDFKFNLYDNEAAVAGINAITNAIKTLTEYAGLRSITDTFAQGAGLASQGLLDFDAFKSAGFIDRQKMVDEFLNTQKVAAKNFNTIWQNAEKEGMASFQSYIDRKDQIAAESASKDAENSKKANEEFRKLTQTKLEKLTEQRDAYLKSGVDSLNVQKWYNDEVAKLNEKETKKHSSELKKQLKDSEKAAKEKAKLAEKFADETRKNNATLDKYWEDYSDRQVNAVADAAAEEKKIREDAAAEAQRVAEDTLQKQQESAQKVLDNITEATADVFYDLFSNIDDGWEQLWKSMKDWAMRTIAQLAAQAATMQIVVPIMISVTGTANATQAVTAMTGQGNGGIMDLLTNMPTGGSGSLLESMPGGRYVSDALAYQLPGTATALAGSFGGVGAATGTYATGLGFSSGAVANGALEGMSLGGASLSASAPAMTGGLSLGSAMGMGSLGGLGYSLLGGALGMPQSKYSGLTASAGGMLGAWGGSALAGAAGGAAAGATAGSVVPVIGTAIGAIIGGLAGSLLGNESSQYPSVMVYDQTHAWGDSSVITKADDGMSKSTADEFGATIGAYIAQVEASVETSLSTFGDEYVAMLDDATVQFGRHTGGSWDEWNFSSDQDMDELWAKAQADLTGKIYEAASGAFTAAGRDIATGEAATRAMELLGEDASAALQAMSDIIMAGVQSGDIETYAAQLQAFQATIQQVSAAWDLVSDASSALVDPLTEYEAAQKQINDQYDSWIATVEALGFASSKTAQLEADRADVLGSLASEYASAINEVMTTAGQTAQPVSAMVEARQQLNAQFDDWSSRLEQLGAAESQLAEIESDRALALQNLVDANEASIAELVGSADAIAHPLSTADEAVANVNKQFDSLVDQLERLGAAESQLALVEEDRATALRNLSDETAQPVEATVADWSAVFAALQSNLETAYTASVDAASAAFDATMANLEASASGLEDAMAAASDAAGSWRSVADSLESAISGLKPLSTAAALGELSGMTSRAWAGETPDDDRLSAVLSAISNIDPNDYATRSAYDADVTRAQDGLAALAEISDAQATLAERQLSELELQNVALERQMELIQENADAELKQLELEYKNGLNQLDTLKDVRTYTGTMTHALADISAMTEIYGDSQALVAERQIEILTAISAALEDGLSVSAAGYASGGVFGGGLRIVGENGPELEATGPSRIWSAAQTRALLGGGQSGADISQLRDDLRAQSRALVAVQQRMTKILERWEINGMPEVRTA